MPDHSPFTDTPPAGAPGAVRVRPQALVDFGRTASTLAERLGEAEEHTLAADPATLMPVFGTIGADVFTALTSAHRDHAAELSRIREVLGGWSTIAVLTAEDYATTDAENAARLGAAGDHL